MMCGNSRFIVLQKEDLNSCQKKNDEIREAHPEAIVVTGFVRFIMKVGNGKIVITSETVPVDAPAKPVLNLTVTAD